MPSRTFLIPLFVALAAILLACQPIPQPFRPDGKPVYRATPGPRTLLVVDPIVDSPSGFHARLAEALQKREIPAVSSGEVANRYHVRGRIVAAPPTRPDSELVIVWTLFDGQGQEVVTRDSRYLVDGVGWVTAEGNELEKVARRAAYEIDSLIGGGEAPARAEDYEIVVTDVAGAPGDGDRALAHAMTLHLRRLGLTVVDSAAAESMKVAADVTVAPFRKGYERVQIVWRLNDENGRELGVVRQDNVLPAGTLDGAWGDIAFAAAEGGAEGIADLIRTAAAGNSGQ
ncbi:hypothetical protein [Oceanibacterium hippocampi]|uniref:Lipoprotein n=1 Tax=Oceanibacterium hippocampi TaxID=745714 RepID=A0A1Y5TVS5_9PROT|nr:hypothetical protein [Oceanibacterium hippocampi]SLN74524.1 hypothetical protein OCH7691_03770 [Oceanibacterium hippocampi]